MQQTPRRNQRPSPDRTVPRRAADTGARPSTRQPVNGIQVIGRAADILRTLGDEREGLSLAEIARRVSLPRSTVQRIVTALSAERLLMAASPNGRVRLGPAILALAAAWKLDIVEIAHPHLKRLSEKTGETVDLAVFRKDHLQFIDQVVGQQRLRAVSAVGEIFPLTTTANGKACLALMDDATIARLLGGSGPSKALRAELAEIRQTGVAYDDAEHSHGISAIGAAFRDPLGTLYAISVPAPTARFNAERTRLKPLILATRDTLAGELGM